MARFKVTDAPGRRFGFSGGVIYASDPRTGEFEVEDPAHVAALRELATRDALLEIEDGQPEVGDPDLGRKMLGPEGLPGGATVQEGPVVLPKPLSQPRRRG